MAENKVSITNDLQTHIVDSLRNSPLTAEELRAYMDKFRMLMTYYRCAIKEVVRKFEVLDEEFSLQYDRDTISSIQSRLKSVSSIFGKLKRRGITATVENIEDKLADIAGIRVICPFLEDVYYLEKALLAQDDIQLIERKN